MRELSECFLESAPVEENGPTHFMAERNLPWRRVTPIQQRPREAVGTIELARQVKELTPDYEIKRVVGLRTTEGLQCHSK